MATKLKSSAKDLYEADFYVWAQRQAEALRAGRLDELDLANLAEEVEGLATALESAVRSRTRTIIEHLLKLQFSLAVEPRNGWRATVRVQRRDLEDDLTPALRRSLEQSLADLYARIRNDLAATMRDYGEHEAAQALPRRCPYRLEDILGDWFPEQPHER
ncbi:MAG: DUF29 domain-containing protein [Geminicoccaceae bacterium]